MKFLGKTKLLRLTTLIARIGKNFPFFTQIKQEGINVLWRNRKATSILILLLANVLNNFALFIINVIVARIFGPDDFGIFSLATLVM